MRRFLVATVLVAFALGWFFIFRETPRKKTLPLSPRPETIPPGIVVTESSTVAPPQPPSSGNAPGDLALTSYADSSLTAQNDLEILSNTLTNFLTVSKQAMTRPLSANEEWSAALTGKRLGSEVWISNSQRILDPQKRLIDRWDSPLHFHALGSQKWEMRSAGPDRILWTEDDLTESLPRSSCTR